MIDDLINITRMSIVGADRLYPKGIDWSITPGVNAVVGGTGLGKTTLVYAIQFAVFGKIIVDSDERIEREFFNDRLTNRANEDVIGNPPRIVVEFNVGGSLFSVQRNLLTGGLILAECDKKAIKGAEYENAIAERTGLGDDFESLRRLQGHLLFFGEGRYLLAWQNLIQHELINLMMSDHAAYVRLGQLWDEAESADSAARNISAQASRLEKDLEAINQKASKVDELKRMNSFKETVSKRKSLEKELASVKSDINENLRLLSEQDDSITNVHAEFYEQVSLLEEVHSEDIDDSLFAAALADPTIASVRHALEQFYVAPENRSCPCCGRLGIEPTLRRFAQDAVRVARAGNCIVCSKELPVADRYPQDETRRRSDAINNRALTLQTLLFEREQTKSRLAELQIVEAKTLSDLNSTRESEVKQNQLNLKSAANPLRIAVAQMRKREADMKARRATHMASLRRELMKTNKVFGDIQNKVATAFKKYATLYLDEPCDVQFLDETTMPGRRGPQIKAPHAAFFPVVSGEIRPRAQALSDAQRSFIDLAFRMAVIEVWHQKTNKTITMIIETPEGAVDIAYMERVATMIRTFGQQGHTLIITTNLNNEIFLPAVMASRPKAERQTHVLSLIDEGNPRPVQLKRKPFFDNIMSKVKSHVLVR